MKNRLIVSTVLIAIVLAGCAGRETRGRGDHDAVPETTMASSEELTIAPGISVTTMEKHGLAEGWTEESAAEYTRTVITFGVTGCFANWIVENIPARNAYTDRTETRDAEWLAQSDCESALTDERENLPSCDDIAEWDAAVSEWNELVDDGKASYELYEDWATANNKPTEMPPGGFCQN